MFYACARDGQAHNELGDGSEAALFPGVYAIFGHGNVTCLGHSLEQHRDELPTWRGQNEQGMALAAARDRITGFARSLAAVGVSSARAPRTRRGS